MVWGGNAQIDAGTLYNGLERSIGAMEDNLSIQRADWGRWQELRPPVFRNLADSETLPGLTPEYFALSGTDEVVSDFLGFSNAQLNLAGRAWYLALASLFAVSLSLAVDARSSRRRRPRETLVSILLCGGLVVMMFLPRVISDSAANSAADALSKGNLAAAREQLTTAASWAPSAALSWKFQASLGFIDAAANCTSCDTVPVYVAKARLVENDLAGAIETLVGNGEQTTTVPGYRYFLSSCYVEAGIGMYNQGNLASAERYYAKALALVPINGMAWYGHALVRVKARDFDGAASALDQMLKLQDQLMFKRATLRSQYSLMKAWAEYGRGNFDQAQSLYDFSLSPDKW